MIAVGNQQLSCIFPNIVKSNETSEGFTKAWILIDFSKVAKLLEKVFGCNRVNNKMQIYYPSTF